MHSFVGRIAAGALAAVISVPASAYIIDPPDPAAPATAQAFASDSFYTNGQSTSAYGFTEGFTVANQPRFDPHTGPTLFTYATSHIVFGPVASVSAYALNPLGGGDYAQSHSTLRYEWTLVVPYLGDNVVLPIGEIESLVSISGHSKIVTAGPAASVRITATAQQPGGPGGPIGASFVSSYSDSSLTHVAVPIAGGAYSNEADFSFDAPGTQVATTFLNGAPITQTFKGTILLEADVYGLVNGTVNLFSGADGTASIDPVITVSGAFRQTYGAVGGTFVLSPGVGNARDPVAGVPEPAAWLFLIAGFGLTGAALRRRRIASAA